jgi:hypothetical protein
MFPYEEPVSGLTISLNRGLYLAIIIDGYERPQIALIIALHRGL